MTRILCNRWIAGGGPAALGVKIDDDPGPIQTPLDARHGLLGSNVGIGASRELGWTSEPPRRHWCRFLSPQPDRQRYDAVRTARGRCGAFDLTGGKIDASAKLRD